MLICIRIILHCYISIKKGSSLDINLYNDDCLNVLKNIGSESIDCVVTDCPYKIIAGGVRVVYDPNECRGVLNKRDYS